MKINKKTLTEKQKQYLDIGFVFSINKNGKIVMEKPKKPYTKEFLDFLEKDKQIQLSVIEKIAENRIKNEVYIRKNRNGIKEFYSDWEIKTWSTKVEEAKKVAGGGESSLLNMYKPKGITLLNYAKKILQKAQEKSVITAQIEAEKNEAINELYK